MLSCDTVYDKAMLKDIFIEGLPESIRSSRPHHWSLNKCLSMNKLALHAYSLRTFQAIMNRPAHRNDEKKYVRSKPSPKLRRNEQASLNVELSESDFDAHSRDHARDVITLNSGEPQSSTFPTSQESLILISGPYFPAFLSAKPRYLAMSAYQEPR